MHDGLAQLTAQPLSSANGTISGQMLQIEVGQVPDDRLAALLINLSTCVLNSHVQARSSSF